MLFVISLFGFLPLASIRTEVESVLSFLFDGGGFHPSTSMLSKSFSPNILWKFWAEKNKVT